LRAYLEPYLDPVLEIYASEGVIAEEALQYLISEELELIHGLFDNRHGWRRGQPPYADVYYELRTRLPVSLSGLVNHHIAAPRVYGDNNTIDIVIQGNDLLIGYYRDPAPEPQSVIYGPQVLVLTTPTSVSKIPCREPGSSTPREVQGDRSLLDRYSKLIQ